jgi:hypothetical protein
LLKDSDVYLDELAGVQLPTYDPALAARFQQMSDKCHNTRTVEGIFLKRGNDSETSVGGTVVALHQYLSPAFLAYYTTDQDLCSYMDDIRSGHKKDQKVRVSSTHHVNTKPTWLQFGDTTDVYLYLSQKASVGEELWLKIVNFLLDHLMVFVNKQSKEGVGTMGWFPADKYLTVPTFGAIIAACSNPREGNYGIHSDKKPGLVHAATPGFSGFNLIVPTLCIQNHCQSTTTISWSSNKDPSRVAGKVEHELNLIHIQLVSVQEYFKHWVRCVIA